MVSAATIADHIHGITINDGAVDPACDCPHGPRHPIDYDRRVQYECIRIGDSLTFLQGLPHRGRWIDDLLRCADCELESLRDPTNGYGEALVELDIAWQDDQLVLDTRDLEVLDHSPVEEGRDPPLVPREIGTQVYQQPDPGLLRRSRLADYVVLLRQAGRDELADEIEHSL